jgi:phosphotransferase system enzyme I (PtsI)
VALEGLAASPGIALGRVIRLDERGRRQFYYVEVSAGQVRSEIQRLRDAFAEARDQLNDIKTRLAEKLGHQHAFILDPHLLMLEDQRFLAELEYAIRLRRINAEWAIRDTTARMADAYKQVNDPYLVDRAPDIEEIGTRLLTILSGHATFNLSDLDQDVVIVAESIGPSTVAELDVKRVLGFATDAGGLTSHSAIIARALGLPAVLGLHDVTRRVKSGETVIVDGYGGKAILRPTRATARLYVERQQKEEARPARPSKAASEPARTLDGTRITLRANVELSAEIESLSLFGAEGIGLYRSEFLFVNRLPELPSEEEQYTVYRRLAEATGAAGANIRVFDLGGDKLSLEGFKHEQNPALGLRAIRLSLKADGIFRTQLRAILRANQHGKLRVVLPLVTTIEELRAAKQIITDVKTEMADAGVDHNAGLPVGVMIEVPAAASMADAFAREVDFLSVGTNDLIQYLLAVDRANENVAHLYQPLHPAVLRTISNLVRAASAAGIPLELCGEMAADPMQSIALVALGIRVLSLVPASIPLIKNAVGTIDLPSAELLLNEAMNLASAGEVQELLSRGLPGQASALFETVSPRAKRGLAN